MRQSGCNPKVGPDAGKIGKLVRLAGGLCRHQCTVYLLAVVENDDKNSKFLKSLVLKELYSAVSCIGLDERDLVAKLL